MLQMTLCIQYIWSQCSFLVYWYFLSVKRGQLCRWTQSRYPVWKAFATHYVKWKTVRKNILVKKNIKANWVKLDNSPRRTWQFLTTYSSAVAQCLKIAGINSCIYCSSGTGSNMKLLSEQFWLKRLSCKCCTTRCKHFVISNFVPLPRYWTKM